MDDTLVQKVRELPIWQGEIDISPLTGGITNINLLVKDAGNSYVVKLGGDILAHHVMRFNECAASMAAYAVNLSPAVIHSEPGITVSKFIESTTFTPELVREQSNLERILPLIKTCHIKVAEQLRGPALIFWVFHVIRDYSAQLSQAESTHSGLLPELLHINKELEKAAAPFNIVFSHNDLLAANILDDGQRLWLIDWDYAGYNSPLFDLSGLASNNELSIEQEYWLLEHYFEAPVSDELFHRYSAMKCSSLLRETMWSMVSEIDSQVDFDYATYTHENLKRFQTAYKNFLLS